MALKRLKKELEELKNNPSEHFYAGPISFDDMFTWKGTILGPSNTPYEGGKFNLKILFPKDYPFKPPKITFLTKIYHPNIDSDENKECHPLADYWSPVITLVSVLSNIVELIVKPIWEDSLRPDIGNQYKNDKVKFDQIAKEWTNKFAN